jgi:phosphatidate cytidylyltransferase
VVWVLVAGLVAYEWLSIVSRRNAIAGGIGVVLAGFALVFRLRALRRWPASPPLAALIGAVADAAGREPLALEACGVAYALAFALVTPALRGVPGLGFAIIIWSFAVVWLTDIAAYFTGRKLGGPS